jgi:glutathione S-transferase
MNKPRLTYFDAPVSRGEECRLALHVAGVDFEDVRLKREQWAALKPNAPYGTLPFFEMEGHPTIGQTNAILVLVGRQHGMHPKDDFEAARHESMMSHVEDLRGTVGPTIRITDEDEKRRAREDLVASYLPTWAGFTEKHIGDHGFFAGDAMNVVDVKLYLAVRWFAGGKVDYIPANVFSSFPKLTRVYEAVGNHPRVKDWYARGLGPSMHTVEVSRLYSHPIERVFARYTDHEGWTQWARLGRVRLVREGSPDRNGVGAVRAFSSSPGLREEVVLFEPPRRMHYRVTQGPLPFDQHLGEVAFEPEGGGTRLTWRVTFRCRIPGLGRVLRRGLGALFRWMLGSLARDLDER